MLQAGIIDLETRQKVLESEISEALGHLRNDDPIVTDLKSRALFVREEIERVREQTAHLWH
jgi:hypothetical protein